MELLRFSMLCSAATAGLLLFAGESEAEVDGTPCWAGDGEEPAGAAQDAAGDAAGRRTGLRLVA